MSHFAKIENDKVAQVIVAEKEFVEKLEGEWIQTSYNTHGNNHTLGGEPLRANYAGVGFIYDRNNDVFYTPKPYKGWDLNKETWLWESPIPYPTDGEHYEWNEEILNWELS